MQFKKGDEIICVDNTGCVNSLTIGSVYVVLDTSTERDINLVKIKNDSWFKNEDYFSSRFVFKTQQHINSAQILKMFNDIL